MALILTRGRCENASVPRAPLLQAAELAELLAGPAPQRPTVLDVRWELGAGAQRSAYRRGHIPGAAFVDLDAELSAPAGAGGRHPLPDAHAFTQLMRAKGVDRSRAVIAYDAGPALAAARCWWLLRHFGHEQAAVLDGGLEGWLREGLTVALGDPSPPRPGDFTAQVGAMPVVDADGVFALAGRRLLLDARAPERFRGEQEPADPVAGHVPGALNRPTTANVGADGRFRPAHELRAEFAALGLDPGEQPAVYCGSGVTAAHEILALELAGYRAALYPGSWSEWITDPSRPVATGG